MCGICGIKFQNSQSDDQIKDKFLKVLNNLHHRGPDSQKYYYDENFYIGATRLKILDLDKRSDMPMVFDNLIISFNGEIYNFLEIKEKLVSIGEKFITTSDTEVILRLFKNYRFESFKMLEGMYAICIYDLKTKEIILARDTFGIKPLYYSFFENKFIFSSELKSITKVFLSLDKINYNYCLDYLIKGSTLEPNTPFKNILSLKAGNILIVQNNLDYKIKSIETVTSIIRDSENSEVIYTKDDFFHELNNQIIKHTQSDVPLALMLSSGIDSIYLQKILNNLITPFTLSYEFCKNTKNDEINEIKKNFSLNNHITHYAKNNEILNLNENFNNLSDTLSIDGLQFLLISQFIHNNNFKVALSGFGGDEIFNSYPSYKYLRFFNKFKKFIPKKISCLINFNYFKLQKLSNLIGNADNLEEMYINFRSIFNKKDAISFFKENRILIQDNEINLSKRIMEYTSDIKFINNKIKSLEMNVYLRDQVLKDLDWASMKYSLEIRVPFLTKSLLKISSSKYLVNSLKKNDLFLYAGLKNTKYYKNYVKRGFSTPSNINKKQKEFLVTNLNKFIKEHQ
jgi:asparagine synthase (glutamine-hydrolysing)